MAGRLWILMDLCEIGSVADLCRRTRTQLSEEQVMSCCIDEDGRRCGFR